MRAAALLLVALPCGGAAAQELCPPLLRFLQDPPKGFLAARSGPAGPQRWATAPIVPQASCDLWQSRSGEADTLHCTINDRGAPGAVAAFHAAGSASIDRCLAGLAVQPWTRKSAPVAVEGLRGSETTWVHDDARMHLKISLTDYLRTVLDTSYNSLDVQYVRY